MHCPITGEPIDPSVSIEQDGKTIYFCCKGCIAKYKANPAKYADALRPAAGLVAYAKFAKDDLVLSATALDKGVLKRSETKTVEYNGLTYFVSGDKAAETFKADPAKYAKALRDDMVKRIGASQAFTCSMHPDIVRAGAGTCPLCSMKLQPVKPSNP